MSDLSDFNESEVLYGLRNGSIEAFELIFKKYWERLYTEAMYKLKSHDEAEEIIQGIFVTLWEKRESLVINDLKSYLFVAVRNRVLNQIRSKLTRQQYWDYYKAFIPQQKDLTDDVVNYNGLTDALEDAINHLPQKSRDIFRLNRMEGKSVSEIADSLHLSEKAIEYHLTKSVKELKVHLKDYMTVVLASGSFWL